MKIHDPGNFKKINEIYVLVSVDENDNEGILGLQIGNNQMPCVSSDLWFIRRIYKEHAKVLKETGKNFRIIKYSKRTNLGLEEETSS